MKLVTLVGNPATPADEADVRIDAVLSDVRNTGSLSDYTGELEAVLPVQLTDRNNGGDAGTAQSFSFSAAIPCTATGSTTVGSSCALHTTADAVIPGAISEGQRAIWELSAIEVRDGGADGLAGTAPNAVFARQGVFIP